MDQTSELQAELAEIRKMASSQLYEAMYQRLLAITVGALFMISILLIAVGVFLQISIREDDFLGNLMLSLSAQIVSSTVVFVVLSLAAKPFKSAIDREKSIRLATRRVLLAGALLIGLAAFPRLFLNNYTYPTWVISSILSPIFVNLGTGLLGAFIIFIALEELIKLFEAQSEINATMMNRIDQLSQRLHSG